MGTVAGPGMRVTLRGTGLQWFPEIKKRDDQSFPLFLLLGSMALLLPLRQNSVKHEKDEVPHPQGHYN